MWIKKYFGCKIFNIIYIFLSNYNKIHKYINKVLINVVWVVKKLQKLFLSCINNFIYFSSDKRNFNYWRKFSFFDPEIKFYKSSFRRILYSNFETTGFVIFQSSGHIYKMLCAKIQSYKKDDSLKSGAYEKLKLCENSSSCKKNAV